MSRGQEKQAEGDRNGWRTAAKALCSRRNENGKVKGDPKRGSIRALSIGTEETRFTAIFHLISGPVCLK